MMRDDELSTEMVENRVLEPSREKCRYSIIKMIKSGSAKGKKLNDEASEWKTR